MQNSKQFAASCLLLTCFSSVVIAAPAVSGAQGSFSGGSAVTISGSGFGTKAVAAPLVFDNFETGTTGSGIDGKVPTARAIGSAWTWSASAQAAYSNGNLRSGSTKNAKLTFGGAVYNNHLEIIYPMKNTGDEAYFTFWYRYAKTSSAWTRNLKPFSIYGTNQGLYPRFYEGWGEAGIDGSMRTGWEEASGSVGPMIWSSPDITEIEGRWIRLEVYVKQSAPSTANGAMQVAYHNPITGKVVSMIQNAPTATTRSSTAYWTQFQLGYYLGGATATGDVYMDDIYFDKTRARVELGDAPTWAGCTYREIQVPAAWTDSSVQVSFNKGTFAAGKTAYLYVVDASGQVNSNGYPVVIGGGSTVAPAVAPPAAPSGLKIE